MSSEVSVPDFGTLWQGRLESSPAQALKALNDSLPFDCRMFREDIEGSRAHATMLASVGLLTESERDDILAALDRVESDLADELAEGCFEPQPGDEDIHTVVERRVTEITPAGTKLHTGRSRNDQVATDLRLWTKNALGEVAESVLRLQEVLHGRAKNTAEVRLPGYTHLQQAQPVTLAHHLLAHGWALSRDFDRLVEARRRADVSPLGAGALAGSSLPINPESTARNLGFASVFSNSVDAVSDRDFVTDALYALAILGVHLSRMGEELVLWATSEFDFVELDDSYTTGSSMMPQKKNPDIAELARAKAGRLIGHLTGMLVVLKGLPLAYAKDLQEDKEPLFDAVDTVQLVLQAFTGMVATARFNHDRMSAAASSPYAATTDLAEWLVLKGMPFRQAHAVVAELVKRSLTQDEDSGNDKTQDEDSGSDTGQDEDSGSDTGQDEDSGSDRRSNKSSSTEDQQARFVELVAQDPDLGPEAVALLGSGSSAIQHTTHGSAGLPALITQLQQFGRRLKADRARLGA